MLARTIKTCAATDVACHQTILTNLVGERRAGSSSSGSAASERRVLPPPVEYDWVPTVSQRLRELDRRVLREQDLRTVDGWRKEMSRWRWSLASAGALGTLVVILGLFDEDRIVAAALMPQVVLTVFRAGQQKVEHDRINGRGRVLGRHRPPEA